MCTGGGFHTADLAERFSSSRKSCSNFWPVSLGSPWKKRSERTSKAMITQAEIIALAEALGRYLRRQAYLLELQEQNKYQRKKKREEAWLQSRTSNASPVPEISAPLPPSTSPEKSGLLTFE